MAENGGSGARVTLVRLLPVLAVAGGLALVFAMGWQHYLAPRAIAEHRSALKSFVDGHLALALAFYVAVYAGSTALSIPGGLALTLLGGFLFGWLLGGAAVLVGATAGACAIFLVAKTALGDALAAKAGPFLGRLREGFARDALNYLLFLRLVPVFPFWLVNLAPAFLGVPFRTFAIGTFIGIVPGTFAYAAVGGGLDEIFARAEAAYETCTAGPSPEACRFAIDASALLNPTLLAAFAALGLVVLVPVALRRLRKGEGAASGPP
ncbi:MAG: TVP38/TMEM64 family protein [Alphaproteobacteria bacterium]|nr:TVP38/TMEM64 family protein [Alphaproteobacteria bacterium]